MRKRGSQELKPVLDLSFFPPLLKQPAAVLAIYVQETSDLFWPFIHRVVNTPVFRTPRLTAAKQVWTEKFSLLL